MTTLILEGVSFNKTWLRNARLDGANCANIFFGEQGYIAHPAAVNVVAFYKNDEGSYWITGCSNGYAYQWDSNTQKQFRIYNHQNFFFWDSSVKITCIAIVACQHLLITGANESDFDNSAPAWVNRIWLWSLQTGNYLRIFGETQDNIKFLSVSPTGDYLASGTSKTILLWSLPKGELKQSIWTGTNSSPWKSSHVTNLCFSSINNFLAAIIDEEVHLWLLPNENKHIFGRNVQSIAFSPAKNFLVVADKDGLWFWSISDIEVKQTLLKYGFYSTNHINFSHNGNWLAFDGPRCDIHIQNTQERSKAAIFQGHKLYDDESYAHNTKITGLAFNYENNWLASTSTDRTLRLWSISNELDTFTTYRTNKCIDSPRRMMFAPSGGYLYFYRGLYHSSRVKKMPWTEVLDVNDRWVASSSNQALQLWSLPDSAAGPVFQHLTFITCASLHKIHPILATGGCDHIIRIWSISEGIQQYEFLGHTSLINSLVFSPDGNHLVSTSSHAYYQNSANYHDIADYTVRLWDVVNKLAAFVFQKHDYVVTNVDFAPNNEYIISICRSEMLVWQYLTGDVLIKYDVGISLVLGGELIFTYNDGFYAKAPNAYSIHLYQLSENGWKKILHLSLWFEIKNIVFSKKYHILAVNGDWEIALFSFDSQDMTKWKLLFSSVPPPLNTEHINITQAINLPEIAQRLCKQRGAIGEPASAQQPYKAWCTLFQPIPGTAVTGSPFSLLSKNSSAHYRISNERWVVAIIRNKEQSTEWSWKSLFGINDSGYHTYLLIEGIKNHRSFIIRAELIVHDNKVIINMDSQCDDGMKEHSVERLEARLKSSQVKPWSISKDLGMRFLNNIRADQQEVLAYAQMSVGGRLGRDYHNCVTWCKRQLSKIEITLPEKWHDTVVVFPSDPFVDLEVGQGGHSLK